jgi:predicted TIM-barrel fold metal-dependent hydrolase
VTRQRPARAAPLRITNCHVHTFTHEHSPDRFVWRPLAWALRSRVVRAIAFALVRFFDRGRRGPIARLAQILDVSYRRDQREVFELVRSFYPQGTRFVVLPMDMTHMGAGRVPKSIGEQHEEVAALRDRYPGLVIPFAAADPRHPDVEARTRRLIEVERFLGIKLYPPIGYHPNDPVLRPLYAYAAERGIPVLTHCSRPASVQFRGTPTRAMRTDPETGEVLNLDREALLTRFTDPDAYVPILRAQPALRLCLAHFGGAGDWAAYLDDPWDAGAAAGRKSWLAKILDMLRSGDFPNLYTDIAYTLFADDEYVYLLKVLLEDESVASHVLFGSDFYVVDQARLEERRRAVRIRAVLGEDLFRTIAEVNPERFLGPRAA